MDTHATTPTGNIERNKIISVQWLTERSICPYVHTNTDRYGETTPYTS